jgi:hypothetical protein
LGANVRQVDLSPCILSSDAEPSILAKWMALAASASDRPDHPAWNRVREFCTRWDDPSSPLHHGVRETWLEFDLEVDGPAIPSPSLFFGLRLETPPDHAYAIAEQALYALDYEPGQLPRPLRQCFEACPSQAPVNQIGVMLSRRTDALRVCNEARTLDPVIPYLMQVGWPGPIDELDHLIAELMPLADPHVMIDIDVSARTHPKLGLELSFGNQPEDEPRWAALLDVFVAHELCTSAKRDALLDWPGVTVPTSEPVPWPGHLIVASLSRPPDQFSAFVRRLLHVKIVYQPGQPLEAKAYLFFEHRWRQPQQPQAADEDRP